jgi:putative CocE/NonD family hydrolase
MWHEFGLYFAARGYPFLAVDVRGRGNSEGIFEPNVNEARDGYDLIEWLAGQPYCNGRVAMWGGSYAGYAQWASAKERPPHLATIVPAAAPYMGVDMPMQSNISAPYVMQWLTLVFGRTLQDKLFFNSDQFWGSQFRRAFELGIPFKELDTFLGSPSPAFQEWMSHPEQDTYWDRYNPTSAEYARLSIPILSITGYYDADQPGALRHHREHLKHVTAEARSRHFLVIGPWDHTGTRTPRREFGGLSLGAASRVDLQGLQLDWYTWVMRGGPKPRFLRNNVAYYVMGAEEWRYSDSLEAATEASEPFYLRSSGNPDDIFHSGLLNHEPPTTSGPDRYVYDPRDVSLAELESRMDPASLVDQRMLFASSGKLLVYHSEPFREQREVSGSFKLSAWLSIDTPDTDFRASVYKIDLSGQSLLLSTDQMRARYRTSLRAAELIRTTEPLCYEFAAFTFVACRLERGERLRLTLGPINSIYSQKNYNSGGIVSEESMRDARTVTVRLFHDRAHPSALYVPFGTGG